MGPARIVDDNIEPPELFDRLGDGAFDIGFFGDIAFDRQRVIADRAGNLLRSGLIEIENDHIGPYAAKGFGNSATKTRCATGDHCCFTL